MDQSSLFLAVKNVPGLRAQPGLSIFRRFTLGRPSAMLIHQAAAAGAARAALTSRCAMTTSGLSGFLSTEFDPFLSSPLWLDRNESPLSVMSALARLDIDPWQEAASLATLSKGAAITRLSTLLGPLPGAPSTKPDREGLCQRALGLLPAQYGTARHLAGGLAPAGKTRTGAGPTASSLLFLGWIVIAGLIGASVLPRLLDQPATPGATAVVHTAAAHSVDGFTTRKD
jgi:hypothetical protein